MHSQETVDLYAQARYSGDKLFLSLALKMNLTPIIIVQKLYNNNMHTQLHDTTTPYMVAT